MVIMKYTFILPETVKYSRGALGFDSSSKPGQLFNDFRESAQHKSEFLVISYFTDEIDFLNKEMWACPSA